MARGFVAVGTHLFDELDLFAVFSAYSQIKRTFIVMHLGFGELHTGFMLAWFLVMWLRYFNGTFVETYISSSYQDYKYAVE